MRGNIVCRWIVLSVAAAPCATAQLSDPGRIASAEPGYDDFRVALEAARSGQFDAGNDSPALRSHPLYAYLIAERIVFELGRVEGDETSADRDAEGFLSRYGGLPVAWPLRYAWAASLARREQWQSFLEQYDPAFSDDAMQCQYLTARINLERLEGIAPAIVERWLTPRQLPGECEPVFQWLRAEGALTDDHVEERVRLLLANGQAAFARIIARRLPEPRAEPLLRWAALIERPAEELALLVSDADRTYEPAALMDAWSRLSRDAPDEALDLYEPLINALQLDSDGAREFTLALALGLAWDRRGESLKYFGMFASEDLDDYALGWRTRAALWAGDWPLAEASIDAMTPAQRDESIWQYWGGRVAETLHGRRDARARYEALLDDDNFYAGLASARLRRRHHPTLETLPRNRGKLDELASRPALVRAHALFDLGLPAAALREWRFGVADLDRESHQNAIHLAADWHWYDLAVATATQFRVFNDYRLLYPMPYADAVRSATRATGLEPELVYGVMRQESLYRADAVSRAGARGLMQLKPGTASRFEDVLGQRLDPEALLDPSVNVRVGSAELARLIDRYDGRVPVALAAYNAGPNAAERWLPPGPMDADIWIENIPFNETRGYVRRVLWHTLVFRWLETRRAQDTRPWLKPI